MNVPFKRFPLNHSNDVMSSPLNTPWLEVRDSVCCATDTGRGGV